MTAAPTLHPARTGGYPDDCPPTVTYWSVYDQRWIRGATSVPDLELAAMNSEDRARVVSHLRTGVALLLARAEADGRIWSTLVALHRYHEQGQLPLEQDQRRTLDELALARGYTADDVTEAARVIATREARAST